jgi:hypothetical protein
LLGELRATKYGISAAQYPTLDIRDLTLPGAKTIYFRDYWTPLGLDRIDSEPISEEVFDTGVNMGRGTAARIAQKSVNFLEIGNPLVEDGLIGPKTFERVYHWGRKDPEAFHKALNGFQFMRYVEIVGRNVPLQAPSWVKGAQYETKLPCREEPRPVAGELPNPTQEKFARGWMKRIQYYRGG